jgi:hypothetical protein
MSWGPRTCGSTLAREEAPLAKNGFRVMDSDLHVVEPRSLWEDYIDPKFRGRIVTVPGDYGRVRAHVDGKVIPPYADRPERQRTSGRPSGTIARGSTTWPERAPPGRSRRRTNLHYS